MRKDTPLSGLPIWAGEYKAPLLMAEVSPLGNQLRNLQPGMVPVYAGEQGERL